jgi:hypothetical protein
MLSSPPASLALPKPQVTPPTTCPGAASPRSRESRREPVTDSGAVEPLLLKSQEEHRQGSGKQISASSRDRLSSERPVNGDLKSGSQQASVRRGDFPVSCLR